MSQLKLKVATRSSKKCTQQQLATLPQKQTENQHNKPRGAGHKRPVQPTLLAMGFKKQEAEIVAEPLQVLYSIKELLKSTTINEIVSQCQKVKDLYQLLIQKSFTNQKLVLSCLDKYFHGNTTSLWINKYAPRSVSELFQNSFAQKIQEWIKDFYYYRKQPNCDNEIDFIDDNDPQSYYSKSLQVRMRQYGWNCRALVLKGRSGVGKTCLLNAIAKSMSIRCFQYASDIDQLKKMKQLEDACQSQCVNNIQNSKKKQQQNNKLIKQNSSITKFLPATQKKKDALETKQPRRMQLFRNFQQYYPPCDKVSKQNAQDNYLRCLFDSINRSTIPHVLTSDNLEFNFRQKNLNQKFDKFDQIEFEENSIDSWSYLYWTIYQIQINLKIDTSKKIKKQNLFIELNSQFKDLQLQCVNNLHLIRQLVINSNKKPLYISKYLQFKILMGSNPSESQNQTEMLNQNFKQSQIVLLEQAAKEVGQQIVENINSHDLVNNIEWSLYNKGYEELNPLEQTAAQDGEKSQKSVCKIQYQIQYKKPTIKQMRQKLDLSVRDDHYTYQNQYYHFKNSISKQQDCFMNIQTNTHIKAKKRILANIKSKVLQRQDGDRKIINLKMKQKQLYYLPLMFPMRRNSRSLKKVSKQANQQNLSKIMNFRELSYLQKFGKFNFPT